MRKQFTWSSLAFLVRFMVPCFWGICAFVFVKENVDLNAAFFPTEEGAEGVNSLMAMPVFLGRILPAGLIGIITAAMLAAFMSTHDTYLLCWSSVITQDIVAPLRKKPLSDASRIRLTRILIVVIGIYILYWGLIYEGGEDIWDYLGVSGAIYFTGAFSVLLFGLYWKGASSTRAALALISGLSSLLGLSPVQDLLGISVPVAWVGLGAVGLSVVAMVAGSLLFPDRKEAA